MTLSFRTYRHLLGLLMMLIFVMPAQAKQKFKENRPCHMELGLRGGAGYYVGDATPHVFQNIRETYGAEFRYKFDKRWAITAKGLTQRIAGEKVDTRNGLKVDGGGEWKNQLIDIDAMAELNFFRFGSREYDRRVKNYTPYIALGVGAAFYGENYRNVAAYIPVALGFRWKFSEYVGLNLAWQHNLYMADNIEGVKGLDNTYDLNGTNIMNFDLTSQLTVGIVFEFGKEKKICRICGN